MTKVPTQTGYAPVNGLKLYYEIHGTGQPLILLHGGVGAIEMLGEVVPALAAERQVIGVHLHAHGRTADFIDRPLSFEAMAEDIAGLIRYLGLEKPDIVGYSLGGGVALRTAIQHPESVRKLVVVSTPFKRDGWYPEVLAAMAQMGPAAAEAMKQSPLAQLYVNVDRPALFTRLGDLLSKDYDWSDEVAAIKAPTMITHHDRLRGRRCSPHRARHGILRDCSAAAKGRRTGWFWKACFPAAILPGSPTTTLPPHPC